MCEQVADNVGAGDETLEVAFFVDNGERVEIALIQ